MGKTTIEWTDATWNPVTGCTEVSPGCANCYAARLAATRLKYTPAYKGLATIDNAPANIGPRWTGTVRLNYGRLEEPLHWRKPRRIFVCDMADLFHEDVPDEFLKGVFRTIALGGGMGHTFQVLTKRAERMRKFMSKDHHVEWVRPMPWLWLGVSVENQHFANERIPALLATPAAVRFVSAEPLLGVTRVARWFRHPIEDGPRLDWVIVGGESGPNARPMHPDWARVLSDECCEFMVPFFFKQWGNWLPIRRTNHDSPSPETGYRVMNNLGYTWQAGAPQVESTSPWLFENVGKKAAGRLLNGREWNEFPSR